MDVKIIEPIKKPIKEFETVNDFNIFYHKHKEEMDAETTHVLNKKYHIKGYRITKIKGVLCLKKDSKKHSAPPLCADNRGTGTLHVSESEVNPQSEALEERIQRIEETLNQLIAHIEQTFT